MTTKTRELIEIAKMRASTVGLPYLKDVPFSVNTRLSSAKGRCKYNRNRFTGEYSNVKIELSKLALDTSTEEDMISTICHELIHTLDNCHNHGNMFQYWCGEFNAKFNMRMGSRYKLVEQSDAFQQAIKAKRARSKTYHVTCIECGNVIVRHRMFNVDNYCCNRCGGKLKLEQVY